MQREDSGDSPGAPSAAWPPPVEGHGGGRLQPVDGPPVAQAKEGDDAQFQEDRPECLVREGSHRVRRRQEDDAHYRRQSKGALALDRPHGNGHRRSRGEEAHLHDLHWDSKNLPGVGIRVGVSMNERSDFHQIMEILLGSSYG